MKFLVNFLSWLTITYCGDLKLNSKCHTGDAVGCKDFALSKAFKFEWEHNMFGDIVSG